MSGFLISVGIAFLAVPVLFVEFNLRTTREDFGDVEVPYTKLLIDADGRVRARFAAATSPHSAELGHVLDEAIESARATA